MQDDKSNIIGAVVHDIADAASQLEDKLITELLSRNEVDVTESMKDNPSELREALEKRDLQFVIHRDAESRITRIKLFKVIDEVSYSTKVELDLQETTEKK